MTEPLTDTWLSRELPVLRAVVAALDENIGREVSTEKIEEATGISADDVQRAGIWLSTTGYVDCRGAWGRHVLSFTGVDERALRAAGLWPTPESFADRLIVVLEQIAANTNDEDTRSRAEKVKELLTGAGQQLAVSVGTALITGAI